MKTKLIKQLLALGMACVLCFSCQTGVAAEEMTSIADMTDDVEAEVLLRTATNDYTTWKQSSISWGDERPWPRGRRFGASGCWITSMAMLLRHYDIVTEEDVTKFNPLICNQRLMECGIVLDTGDYLNAGVERIFEAFPGIYYVADVPYSFEKLKELYDQGYICIVHENKGHYVAVREVTEDKVLVMDPGYDLEELTSSNFIQYFSKDPVYTVKGLTDKVAVEDGKLVLEGWAYDRQDPMQCVTIGVTVGAPLGSDGILFSYAAPAQLEREELLLLESDKDAGKEHGYSFRLDTGLSGQVPVYVYAMTLGEQARARMIHQENVLLP